MKDGLHNICRECASAYHKQYRMINKKKLTNYYEVWRKNNADRLKEYKRTYYQKNKESIMAKHREYDKKHIKQKREANKRYCHNHPDRVAESNTKYRRNNPEKYKAHNLVSYAVKNGRLSPQFCECCGEEKTEAHHDDYSKPLEVRWLCHKCHMEWHANKRNEVDNNIEINGGG